VKELEATLRAKGKDATFHVYPGTHHAFFNDTRADVYNADAARTSWDRTLALFRAQL
jgi:carboxymethylenebutenolidase